MENKTISEWKLVMYAERLNHFNEKATHLTKLMNDNKIVDDFEFEISKVNVGEETITTTIEWGYNRTEDYNEEYDTYSINLCITKRNDLDECLKHDQYHFNCQFPECEISSSQKVRYSKSIDGLIDVIEKKISSAIQ